MSSSAKEDWTTTSADIVADEETALRVLFDALPDALAEPDFGIAFAHYLRRRLHRLHPPGERDLRTVRSRAGLDFLVDLGDRFAAELYYGQFAESFDLALMAALTEPGSVMVDTGANFGLYAATCGRKIDPVAGGRVIALEPSPSVLPLLRENIERNGLSDRVEVVEACAGEADGETAFSVAAESSLSSIAATGRSAVEHVLTVPMRSLASLLSERDQTRLDLLKIDTEGHEHAVLRGALSVLKAGSTIAMAEIAAKNLDDDRRCALKAVLEELYETGYVGRWMDPVEGDLRTVEAPQNAVDLTSANLFLCRRDSPAERRLLTAAAEVRTRISKSPAFVPVPQPASDFAFRAGSLSGHEHGRAQMLAVHLRRERRRSAELAKRLAERAWLERGMQRIAGSEQRIIDEIRVSGTAVTEPRAGHDVTDMVGIGSEQRIIEEIRKSGIAGSIQRLWSAAGAVLSSRPRRR